MCVFGVSYGSYCGQLLEQRIDHPFRGTLLKYNLSYLFVYVHSARVFLSH